MEPDDLDTPDQALAAAELFIEATADLVESLRPVTFDLGSPHTPLMTRAIICRQHDYLGVAADLSRKAHGWAIVPLLRPACEELIWLTALAAWPESAREEIMLALSVLNFMEDVQAQEAFSGRVQMAELGYPHSLLTSVSDGIAPQRAKLRRAFVQVGYELRRNQSTPSVAALARSGGLEPLYRFIYHATSATVHFRPGQLARGVWGKPGDMRVDLQPVERRLADFGMYWGVRLVIDTLIAGLPLTDWDDPGRTLDAEKIERAARLLGGLRPFVLPDELAWPDPPERS